LRRKGKMQQVDISDSDINPALPFFEGDVPKTFVVAAKKHSVLAWDIETSGLDWRSERIGLCQLLVDEQGLAIVKIKKNKRPQNLATILSDPSVMKIFHHAMFDLRFMSYHWGVAPANIACTKIAAKLIDPEKVEGHRLSSLVLKYLNVELDKSSQRSDWLRSGLSPEQIRYAGDDVKYLSELLSLLMEELRQMGRSELAQRCFDHIPTQVQLDIAGFKDIYGY